MSRCVRYVVGKEVFICAERSELDPRCYFVRGIVSLSLGDGTVLSSKPEAALL